ncbi:MAG: heavy metal-binding domain-containing protein [Saprospiraceae bacterium]|nr:heavy metal-binding domain-containing protein [Saprospiraceae bacterium]
MKQILKFTTAIIAFITIVFLSACNNNASTNKSTDTESIAHTTGEHAHQYRCPMNCENGKTYDKEGNCPVCGMKLEHYDGTDNGLSYKMEYTSTPGQLEAGKAGVLNFTPKVIGQESEAVALDVQHEKKIHLIVVSNDLSYFEHIHPEYQADGSYKITVLEKSKSYSIGPGHHETRFVNGGDYTLFADYLPSGGDHQVEKIAINVSGTTKGLVTYSANKLIGTSADFTVSLQATGGKLITGAPMHIAGELTQNGKAIDVNTLENYLGAKAHMVVVSLNDKEYLHVHPDVSSGKFDLHTTFKKPGIYRGWIQFQSNAQVHTVDFVMDVNEGTVDEIKKATEGHDAKEGGHEGH